MPYDFKDEDDYEENHLEARKGALILLGFLLTGFIAGFIAGYVVFGV